MKYATSDEIKKIRETKMELYRRSDSAEFKDQKPGNMPTDNEVNSTIDKLMNEYRERIEDFKNIYPGCAKLPISSIDSYENKYSKQLEIISQLELKQYRKLLNHIYDEIEKFIEPKKYLGFDKGSSKYAQSVMKRRFVKSPPIQIAADNTKALAASIYVEDPWGQDQPRNDDELKIHYDWWEIEKWKHRNCEKLLKSNPGVRDQLSVANNWLPDLIKEIGKIEDPTHENILEIIQFEFQEFKEIPGEVDKKFIKGLNNIHKGNIDLALTGLFNKRYKNKNIKPGTIKKRANELNWWKK